MDKSWKDGAVQFYQECQEFFKDSQKIKNYSYYFNSEYLSPKNQNLIKQLKEKFSSMSVEKISKDYEFEFKGSQKNEQDIAKFLEGIWLKEKKRIEEFLEETLEMLQNDLNINFYKKQKVYS